MSAHHIHTHQDRSIKVQPTAKFSERHIQMSGIKDRIVILTGASSGIGWATAVALIARGAHVLASARREARLEELHSICASGPGQLIALPGDIQDPEFSTHMVKTAVARFQRIDVLINNAGVGHRSKLATIPRADVDTIWQTNVNGPLFAIQAALPQMRTQGYGHIINVSSIVSLRPLPRSAVYCASKAALNFLSRSLRFELEGDNIAISLVYPGGTHTEFNMAALGEKGPASFSRWRVPAERVAATILKTMQHRRPHVTATPFDWLFMHTNRLFPHAIDWIVRQYSRRYLAV
jgi:short-subunit dehydrogenase